MPVYIPKYVSFTPPSLDNVPMEDDDDYITDPDLLRDELPQPYRMIDKTLHQIIDDSWEVIATREEVRLAEGRTIQAPTYGSSVQLDNVVPNTHYPEKQKLSYATCMCNSVDGEYVFIGLPCGLVALEALTQHLVGSWEEDGAEMSYMKSYKIGPNIHLITTIDDMGIGRLFAFAYSKMFLLKVFNPPQQETENKVLISKLEASSAGDYVGIVMENPSNHDLWLEIHKLPRDTWVTDIESMNLANKRNDEKEKKDESVSEDTESVLALSEHAQSKSDTEEASLTAAANSTAGQDTSDHNVKSQPAPGRLLKVTFANPASRQLVAKTDPVSGEFKFASSQLIMKVKPPHTVTGVTVSSLHSTVQKVDSGDVVGVGHNFLFSQNHIDLRQSIFEHIHDNLLEYLPKDEAEASNIIQYPNFQFMTAGKMLPLGLEQASLEGRPTTVAVWWPGTSNLLQYSLIKSSKEIEFKPDLVWPFTSKITCVEVSQDTNMVAIGLEKGHLVVWNKYMGTQHGVINVCEDSSVCEIMFLDPALYVQERSAYPPYPTSSGTYMLVMCANSALYTVATGTEAGLQFNTLSMSVNNDNEAITKLLLVTYHPELLLTVTRKGDVQIRDILLGVKICQISLPSNYELASPWEPVLAIGGQGQNMFLKGMVKQTDDKEINDNMSLQPGSVFIYQLKYFPTLDSYWKRKRTSLPYTVHTTLDKRVDTIFTDRISQQAARKERMSARWGLMKDEVSNISMMKEIAKLNAEKRTIVSPGSTGLGYTRVNFIF